MSRTREVLIVGGGLGGLTTALALAQKGFPVRLIEQTDEIGAIGYGIQMGPNAVAMLDRLGVGEAVRRASSFPSALTMRDALTGEQLARVPFDRAFDAIFASPYVAIHRVDLHNILFEAVKAFDCVKLELSTAVIDFEDAHDTVRVSTKDGRQIEGQALIAADGLRSIIRARMYPNDLPRPNGYVAHRTIAPMNVVPYGVRCDDVVLWAGPGFHIIHYALRGGTEFNIVAVFRTATYAEQKSPDEHKAELQRTYRNAHPDMQAVLALMDLSRRWPIADRDPIRHWARGRVTLLGDSAHATYQSLAQGAGMAIEDACYLATLLGLADGDVVAAFNRLQNERVVRTTRVQLESRHLWETYHLEDDLERDVRRQQYQEKRSEDYFRCLSWLWHPIEMPSANGAHNQLDQRKTA